MAVELGGFRTTWQGGVLVRSGQTGSVAVRLAVGSLTETVAVTSAPSVVDVTSAVVAEDITLDLNEAVPTGRSYQSYLQLVPGFPTTPNRRRTRLPCRVRTTGRMDARDRISHARLEVERKRQ